jgi:hypothetical protein
MFNLTQIFMMLFCVAGSYLHEFMPRSPCAEEREAASSSGNAEVLDHDGGIPIFRLRSAEETEVAHDLLELSRSLPPLPPPGQASAVPLSSLQEDEPHLENDHENHIDENLDDRLDGHKQVRIKI